MPVTTSKSSSTATATKKPATKAPLKTPVKVDAAPPAAKPVKSATKADSKIEIKNEAAAGGLHKTLGLKSGLTMVLIDAPSTFSEFEPTALQKMGIDLHTAARRGVEFDIAVLFVPSNKMLTARLGPLSKSMKPGGSLWVAFPKKTSGMSTDLSDEAVKRIGGAIGSVEGKPSNFDKTWNAMRVIIAAKV